MAQGRQDILGKLQDRGETVVGKYMPAAQRIFEAGSGLTKRVDELTKRVTPAGKEKVRKAQEAYVRRRNACGADRGCIDKIQEDRVDVLRQLRDLPESSIE